jgi:suppressor for copper-sensitivity B
MALGLESSTFVWMLGLALLGGLILNVMPCVLPVLSVKLMNVAGKSGRDGRHVRLGFLVSSAGVLAAFIVLAVATILAKATGAMVGWGFQFQQPVFLVALALICTAFAANLWGLFDIQLPAALLNRVPMVDARGLAGDFSTGVFATLLATPCSAPFLGTAVSFALAHGPLDIFAIFVALGLGLAMPYLMVAAIPGLTSFLPRPGPWMVMLRRVLGFALAGTAVWLVFVLLAQVGTLGAMLVAGCLASLLLLLWMRRRFGPSAKFGSWIPLVSLASLALAVAIISPWTVTTTHTQVADVLWRPFDESKIDTLVRQGYTVVVDVTADWCVTCKANKMLVLDRAPVADEISQENVVAMVADWTSPSARVNEFIVRFRRAGIPLTVVFGPHAASGILLPEILTSDRVLAALKEAAGRDTGRDNGVTRTNYR